MTKVSVRELALSLFRRGDLYKPTLGRSIDAEEGIQIQKKVQKQRSAEIEGYDRERKVSWSGPSGLEISGRMDGIAESGEQTLIEEFKTCGALPDEADPVDWGQLYLYCALYCAAEPERLDVHAKLVYVEADTLDERCFETVFQRNELIGQLDWMLSVYSVALQRLEEQRSFRYTWCEELEFPMPDFRRGQQALARRVYQSVKSRADLLLEAPTGSGKSLAVLFPALKAMAQDAQLFFLTGRNAGREAALNAAINLDPNKNGLLVVDITAKEKICFVEGMPCDPSLCQYASGYYDKLGNALEAGRQQKFCDRFGIEQIALDEEVCPFEFSLDLALEADLIVGDYNYIFDPIVRMQRFSQAKDMHLLCDEVHQLVPRMRDALSVAINRFEIRTALKAGPAPLQSRIKSLDRALMKYRKGLDHGEHVVGDLSAIDRAARRFVELIAELEFDLSDWEEVRTLYFSCLCWVRSEDWREQGIFYNQIDVAERSVRASYVCIDPGEYIQQIFGAYASSVRFSATLTPLELTAKLQGSPEIEFERAQNPFDASQLSVLFVNDISTYYRQRQHSLPKLAQLIRDVTLAKQGRYLVALPSYEYLSQLQSQLVDVPVHAQTSGASAEALVDLVEALRNEGGVLLVVMGGSLSESVDFMGARLDGVIVIGLGLPPPSLFRDSQAAHFEDCYESGAGQLVAYTQPAMTKILQTAGRLIRDVKDRGIICLVDPRFRSPAVRQFFPEHWQVQEVESDKVSIHVRKFWSSSEDT